MQAELEAIRDQAGLRIVDWSPPGSFEVPLSDFLKQQDQQQQQQQQQQS